MMGGAMTTETTEQTESRRRPRHRSPGYPGIGLADAIERARLLYTAERMNAAPVSVANGHWGLSSASSSGSIAIAALKKFGLLDDERSGAQRTVKLTERARLIILEAEGRAELIRAAALSPTIHAELWERYSDDGLPSRDNIRRYLIIDRSFNERAVDDFIDQFIATLEFAGVLPGDTMSADEPDTRPSEDGVTSAPIASPAAPTRSGREQPSTRTTGLRKLPLPIRQGKEAVLYVPDDLDEPEWSQMMAVLNAMKPGILADEEHEAED